MYNSSIKGQSKLMRFRMKEDIPHEVFFNDMSKTYMREEFKSCDCVFSEIAWSYGYGIFNERAGNSPNDYSEYMRNIQKLILELNVPSFVVCGKPASKFFDKAESFPITIDTSETNMPNCRLYVWNFDYTQLFQRTSELMRFLSERFHKCLDFSCGYGEHLLKFDDFIGCDINKDCLTYLSILKKEKDKHGKT